MLSARRVWEVGSEKWEFKGRKGDLGLHHWRNGYL